MTFTFQNNIHQTTAKVTARGYHLSRRQVRRLWLILCGDLDCPACDVFGLDGSGKYRLKKGLFCEGAEIIP